MSALPREATSHVDEHARVQTGCRVSEMPLPDTFGFIDGRIAVLFARRLSGEEAMRLNAVARRRRERAGAFCHARPIPSTLRNSWDGKPQLGFRRSYKESVQSRGLCRGRG
jgi:hypothetical protein